MCQFCVEHGEGKRWYLNAENYAYDLSSDLKRRGYVVDFIRGFPKTRATGILAGNVLSKLPRSLAQLGGDTISRNMRPNHFGQPLPIEDVEEVFRLATSITVIPCICRMHEPGKSAEEVCILVTTKPIDDVLLEGFSSYDDGPGLDDFRTITADEAMTLVRECETRGLMHSIWTFQTPFTAAICNCNLESGCMAMKLTAGYGIKMMWRGEEVATLDEEHCTRCAACKKICPFDAISAGSGRIAFHPEKCWGCGICRSACKAGAITLVDRRDVPAVAALW